MAITTIATPQTFTPGYNPIWYVFDSDEKNQPNFRYRVTLLAGPIGATAADVTTFLVPPSINTGYCNVEFSTLLQSFLTNNGPNEGFNVELPNHVVKYGIEISEQFTEPWDFQDTEFNSSSTFWNGYMKLTSNPSGTAGTLDPHPYSIGDQITITDTQGFFTDDLYTVQEIPDIYSVVVSKIFVASATNPGTTQFADRRTTIGATASLKYQYAFNGAFKYNEWPDYDQADYGGTGATNGFLPLTTCPISFNVQPETIMSFSYWIPDGAVFANIQTATDFWRRGVTGSDMIQIPVGPGNVNLADWTHLIGTATGLTGVYNFYLTTSTVAGQTYSFTVEEPCTKWGNRQLVFMDRLGSFGSFSFNYNWETQTSINRSSQRGLVGGVEGSAWTYDTSQSQSNFIRIEETRSITLTTAWLTEADSAYFQDLIRSPKVWISDEGGALIPVTAITNSITEDRKNSKRNIRYTISLNYSNNDKINW
jgi:hypothetical protein